MSESVKPRFLVDAMLGRLSTWLRLAGYDTLYDPDVHDDELLEIASSQKRVLLTSDYELHTRAENRDIDCLLVRGKPDDALADVFHEFNISPKIVPPEARCSKCNSELAELHGQEKERIKDLVFEQTYDHYDVFWFCQDCQNVYFQGGYWDNIQRYMEHIQSLIDKID